MVDLLGVDESRFAQLCLGGGGRGGVFEDDLFGPAFKFFFLVIYPLVELPTLIGVVGRKTGPGKSFSLLQN